MSDISVIEFGVYGFVTYSSLWVLISSINKEIQMTKTLSILRSIFLIPGLICSAVLASSGVNIQTNVANSANIIKDLNNTQTWSEVTSQTTNIVLQNPIWITVHFMIFVVLLIYVITQMLALFTKHD